MHEVQQDEPLSRFMQSARVRAVHNIEQEPDQQEEIHIGH